MPDPVPVRLQRLRTRGFNLQSLSHSINGLPAKCCTRPAKWSNRFKLCKKERGRWTICDYRGAGIILDFSSDNKRAMASLSVQKFLAETKGRELEIRTELRGYNLACFCRLCPKHSQSGLPLGEECPDCDPCHVSVLLEIANG